VRLGVEIVDVEDQLHKYHARGIVPPLKKGRWKGGHASVFLVIVKER